MTSILLIIPPLLFALTFHEFSHALIATRLGDPTARLLGRLTLNPIPHLDVMGTLVFVMTQRIGWAKPVPIDERYLKHPRRDIMWIALAGPVSNLLLAVLFGTLVRFLAPHAAGTPSEEILRYMIVYSVVINLGLMAFNLIPIFPLDGSRILTGILSRQWAERYRELDRFGPILLMGIVVLGMVTGINLFSWVVTPVINVMGRIIMGGAL
ncbi:MAG TPA: site-2 protease family protein [Candidatus Saccharimonadales bacterium]|nr:site-2 protease family protein [Candidatus Saccharimonadales bacterium]